MEVPRVSSTKTRGGFRVPIDFRELNKITKVDSYPMPNIEDIFDKLCGAKVFTKLDAKSGFLQVDMHPRDVSKTAFATKDGIFEFLKMPYGLVNASATFQRIMDHIFSEEKWKFVMVYIDDVLIFSNRRKNTKFMFKRC